MHPSGRADETIRDHLQPAGEQRLCAQDFDPTFGETNERIEPQRKPDDGTPLPVVSCGVDTV